MRISFVLPDDGLSGGVRVVAIYAQRLHDRGHSVQVVSVPPRPLDLRGRLRNILRGTPGSPPRQSYFDGLTVPHHVLPERRPVNESDLPDADVVIATWWETAEWVMQLSASKGAKTHFIQHHEVFPNQPADRVNAVWRLPMHKITIARWLKHLALETFGDAEVSLVENSVDTTQFHAPPRGRRQSPTIGFLYSDVPWKGVADTCAVVERLRARLPDLRVRCFGSNPLAPQVPLPPGAEFTLRPPQSRLREIYASLDLWLCASHAEGFHLPPLEAMACRTPVVATEVGGAVEIIEPGKNGFLAPVRDVDQLAHHAAHVLTLPNEAWVAMSQAAHERAHRYTWDDATTLFERALEHAVERAARGQIAGGLPRATSTDRRA